MCYESLLEKHILHRHSLSLRTSISILILQVKFHLCSKLWLCMLSLLSSHSLSWMWPFKDGFSISLFFISVLTHFNNDCITVHEMCNELNTLTLSLKKDNCLLLLILCYKCDIIYLGLKQPWVLDLKSKRVLSLQLMKPKFSALSVLPIYPKKITQG